MTTLLTPAQIQKRWDIKRTTFYKIVKEKGFPKPIKLTETARKKYKEEEIEKFEKTRVVTS